MRFASFSDVVTVAVSSAKDPALPSRPMIVCLTASWTRGGRRRESPDNFARAQGRNDLVVGVRLVVGLGQSGRGRVVFRRARLEVELVVARAVVAAAFIAHAQQRSSSRG